MSNLLDLAGGMALLAVTLAGLMALGVWLAKAPAGDLRVMDAPADEQPRSLLAVRAAPRQRLPTAPLAHVGYAAQGQPAPHLSDAAATRLISILTDVERWAEFPTSADRDALN